jgi:hypothetical protein
MKQQHSWEITEAFWEAARPLIPKRGREATRERLPLTREKTEVSVIFWWTEWEYRWSCQNSRHIGGGEARTGGIPERQRGYSEGMNMLEGFFQFRKGHNGVRPLNLKIKK